MTEERVKSSAATKVKADKQKLTPTKSGLKVKSTKADKKETVKIADKLEIVKPDSVKLAKLNTTVSAKSARDTSHKLSLDVYDITGKVTGSIELPKEIFGVKVNKQLLSQAVRVYLANQRAGRASTKTRGEVQGSTRKIYRQKGTGRARHGGIRAPIFVHGGIAHGPKPKDFSLKLTQKMRVVALFSALSAKVQTKSIKIVAGIDAIEPKTKTMAAFLTNLGLGTSNKKLLFILDKKHSSAIRAVRNIEGVTYEFVKQLHVYEILNSNTLVFMKEAIDELEKSRMKKSKK